MKKAIVLLLISTSPVLAGQFGDVLLGALFNKLTQRPTTRETYIGDPRYKDDRTRPRDYLGQAYLDKLNNAACAESTSQGTKATLLSREKLERVLSLYPRATLVRPTNEKLPQSVIILLER